MMDNSPDPPQPSLAVLSQAVYQCRICGKAIIQVEGNQLKILVDSKDSVHAQTSNETDGDDVYIVVELEHIDKPDVGPGNIANPDVEFGEIP